MLDENLPTFYLRASNDSIKHHATVLFTHQGSEASPVYSIRHPDPAAPGSKNRYAVALYDSYNPQILYGEVLLIPEWNQPSYHPEDVRQNGGVPPPPQPILPTEFAIQLYNPDQQIVVKWNQGSWNSSPYWGFEMPQQSFREPSTSAIDRTQSDPTAAETTPKLGFRWKKEGKLSKDYVCSLSGKSTNPDGSKRKHKEPDITIAIFKNFKEITIYEPNLSRVEMEDPKGLEVVLLLGAIVIREVFNSSIREAFCISDNPAVVPSLSSSRLSPTGSKPALPARHSTDGSRPPPTDPRSQWELDAETARLKKQVAAEEKERKRADAAEAKRVKRMLEDEERQRREKQKEIDKETERLKRIYGKEHAVSQQQLPPMPSQPNAHSQPVAPQHHQNQHHSWGFSPHASYQQPGQYSQAVTSYPPAPVQRPVSTSQVPYVASNLRPPQPIQGQGQHLHPGPQLPAQQRPPPRKSSFWHFGSNGTRDGGVDNASNSRLQKQRSTGF